jgi:hypothetical protein
VAEDRRAQESDASFMLGRFVCPASRVDKLRDVERGLSVVLDAPVPDDPRIEAIETYPHFDPGAGLLPLPPRRQVYVELPVDDFVEDRFDHLAEFGIGAKVRCGGTSVPDSRELARFIRACAERGIPFTATAGLHHAVRRNGEHGFLNLLAAVVFCEEESALEESDAAAFTLDPEGFRWRDRVAAPGELAHARRERLHSIGSCSFFEPVDELEAMGILPL